MLLIQKNHNNNCRNSVRSTQSAIVNAFLQRGGIGIPYLIHKFWCGIFLKMYEKKYVIRNEKEYQENLLCDIFEVDKYEKLTSDQEDGLKFALAQLSEAERKTLELRYQTKLTLQQIADQTGVTREGARRRVVDSIRKLRRDHAFIHYGLQTMRHAEDGKEICKETEAGYANLWDRPLDELKLSVRSSNGLVQAGCRTIRDVERLINNPNWYKNVSGMGVGCAAEIQNQIESLQNQSQAQTFDLSDKPFPSELLTEKVVKTALGIAVMAAKGLVSFRYPAASGQMKEQYLKWATGLTETDSRQELDTRIMELICQEAEVIHIPE